MLTESNRVEFKREINDKLEREIVDFLNYQEGGVLYVGIEDDGTVVGVENVDSLQLKVMDRLKNNIQPSTLGLFDVVTTEIEGKSVLKILVSSGPDKPYYLSKFGMSSKGCFIRVGSSVQPMNSEMIDNFYSKRTRNSLGKITSPRQGLTFAQLKIFYEANGFELNKNFAQSLELITEENGSIMQETAEKVRKNPFGENLEKSQPTFNVKYSLYLKINPTLIVKTLCFHR